MAIEESALPSDDLLEAAIGMLREVEWGGTIWTDYACCLFCSALLEGLPATKKYPGQAAGQHDPDCRWTALMERWQRSRA